MDRPTLLQDYAANALELATLSRLDDGSWTARVELLSGVIAFGDMEDSCRMQLLSVIEDWARLRIQRSRSVPTIGDVDFNDLETRLFALRYD